jgi:hypothetical protein
MPKDEKGIKAVDSLSLKSRMEINSGNTQTTTANNSGA